MPILNFLQFSKVNESSDQYSIPGVIPISDMGYEFSICDPSKDSDGISVSNINGNSICLTHSKSNGEETDSLWIPLDSVEIRKDQSDKIVKVILSPYGRWILDPSNSAKVEDFIESFADGIERSKLYQDHMENFAKDDIEIILDLLDIPLNINGFVKSGDNTWEAVLDNGSLIEIVKRSKDDLIGSFKMYSDKSDHMPSVYIKNDRNRKSTIFNLSKDSIPEIEDEIGFSDLKRANPYHRYLLKRGLNIESQKDKDSLVDYFKEIVGSHNKDYKNSEDQNIKNSGEERSNHIKRVSKVLTTFLPLRDVEDMINS